MVGRN